MNNVTANPFRQAQKIASALHDYLVVAETTNGSAYEAFMAPDAERNMEVSPAVRELLAASDVVSLSPSWNGSMVFRIQVVKEDVNTVEEAYKMLANNRLTFILHNALLRTVKDQFAELGFSLDTNMSYFAFSVSEISVFKTLLKIIAESEYHPVYIAEAAQNYTRTFAEYGDRMRQRGLQVSESKTTRGISTIINKKMEATVDKEAVEAQIKEAEKKLQNGLVGRTWGWEVEAPNPGDFTSIPGVEAGSDGSVESYESDKENCECGCRDCTYHSCDCDNCDDYNEDPDHCGYDDCVSCQSYEFRTVGGVNRVLHPGLKNLLGQISETEKNETAGTHIHVYARDLDAFQIGIVLGGYALTQKVWDVISGRNAEDDQRCRTYANLIPADNVSQTLRTKKLHSVGKFNAVNTLHVGTDRGTLEFRQMDCNFDFNRISLMAFMVRGLVEVAKRGAKLNEFIHIEDLNGLIKLYAEYGFTFDSETETIDNPHGSRYNQSRTAPQLA